MLAIPNVRSLQISSNAQNSVLMTLRRQHQGFSTELGTIKSALGNVTSDLDKLSGESKKNDFPDKVTGNQNLVIALRGSFVGTS